MKTRFAAPARQQADRIDRWWRENRPAARDLFARELEDARALLAVTPDAGSVYTERGGTPVRRPLLPRTRHHVYYENDFVTIVAVWGAPQGRGPRL